MKHRLWRMCGRIVWLGTWPATRLILNGSTRTRLVVFNDAKKVLVLKTWMSGKNEWVLPGGGLHRGEDLISGLLREVREETGMELQPDQVQSVGTQQMSGLGFRCLLHCYVYSGTITGEPTLALQWPEILEAAWVDPRSLTPKNAAPDVLEIIQTLVGQP